MAVATQEILKTWVVLTGFLEYLDSEGRPTKDPQVCARFETDDEAQKLADRHFPRQPFAAWPQVFQPAWAKQER